MRAVAVVLSRGPKEKLVIVTCDILMITRQELDPAMEDSLGELLGKLVHPNLNFNSNETQLRRQQAADAVDQVFYEVQRGRTIVREGDPVTPKIERELAALGEQWSGGGSQTSSAGLTVVVGLAIFGFWRFVRHRRKKIRFQRVARLYHLILVVLVSSVLMTRVMVFVGDAVAGSFLAPPYNVAESYRFAIPFAMGALALVLLGVGLLLIMAEVLIPSMGMLGGLAAMALIGSVVLAYEVSAEVGQNFLIAEAVLVPSMVMLGLKFLPMSPFTKFLVAGGFSFKDGAAIDERDKDLLGKRGVVEAPLRPAGTARIEGRRVDVVTRGDMIETGAWVEVTGLSGNRVEVSVCDAPSAGDGDTQDPGTPQES